MRINFIKVRILRGGIFMNYQINGLRDIYTVLANERRIGGAIEAQSIRLSTGEVFNNPVITHIDFSGFTFYTMGFVTDQGLRMIVNVNEISKIFSPEHKRIKDLQNSCYKKIKVEEKLRFLKRLCEVNEGCHTKTSLDEIKAVVNDIGLESLEGKLNVDFLLDNQKVVHIA